MTARSALVVVGLAVVMGLAACSDNVEGDALDPSSSERASSSASAAPAPPSGSAPTRPYERLDGDQPGGPAPSPAPAEPAAGDLTSAADAPADRAAGERAAVLINHAVEDQTSESARAAMLAELAPGARQDALATIEAIPVFPGARILPGTQSWLRSTTREPTTGRLEVNVRLVEQVEVPGLGTPGSPYRFWCDNRVAVVRDQAGWRLEDLQRAVASETTRFSPQVWQQVMDRGRGWRRFAVTD